MAKVDFIKFNQEQIDDMIDRYTNKRESLEIIGNAYSVSIWKIQKELTKNGVQMRKHTEYTPGRDKANRSRKLPRTINPNCLRCKGERKSFILHLNKDDMCYECKLIVNRQQSKLLYKYKMKVSDFLCMLESQNYSCDICKDSFYSMDRPECVCVDHCHITGNVRGILCNKCNTGIGFFKENIDIMKTAIEYVTKHSR